MSTTRTANLLGALALVVADRMGDAASGGAGRGAAAPAALVSLLNAPGLSVGGLARVVGLSHPGTVRLVDRLVADGLVERRAAREVAGAGEAPHAEDVGDARVVRLRLTAPGALTARSVLAARAGVLDDALAALDDEECRVFGSTIELLLAALTPDPDVADHVCRLCDEQVCPLATCPVEQAITGQRASRDGAG